MIHSPNFMTQTQGKWTFIFGFYCFFYIFDFELIIYRIYFEKFSLIANITELEKQISEMELRLHRDKEQLITENGDLKNKVDHLKQQNLELDRKINTILK